MAHRRFHHVRHHAGRAMSGAKGSLIGAASGAATAAVSGYAAATIPFLQTGGWWAMPAALALVGHFLKRKNPTIGGAILGIAGYQAYGNYVSAHAATGAKGFIDAGVLVGPPEATTRYIDSPRTTASLATASGQDAGMLINKEVMGMSDSDAGELFNY